MFGFLKNKLKEAISKFSKKAEEEAKVEEPIETKEKIKKEPEKELVKKTKEEKQKKGFFAKLTEKLTTKKIDDKQFEDLFYDLELALLENNVALEVIDKIKEDLKIDLVNVPLKGKIEDLIKNSLKNSLEEILKETNFDLINEIKNKKEKPYVIAFFGVNGTGKTTTIAKVAKLCQDNELNVVFGAADSFRSGAVEQLEEWGKRLNVKVIKNKYGSDPASICFDTISFAKNHGIDAVLLDTAGRQHSNKNLMEEMKKIVKVSKPDLKIFIGESLVGNDSVIQSQEFNNSIGIDGIILTKSDVDEKGGAIISISYVTQKPIIYLGCGQNLNDLEKFSKDKIISDIGIN